VTPDGRYGDADRQNAEPSHEHGDAGRSETGRAGFARAPHADKHSSRDRCATSKASSADKAPQKRGIGLAGARLDVRVG
jgi:hypothetical protein